MSENIQLRTGDVVRLIYPYQHKEESRNWAIDDKLEYDKDYIVGEVNAEKDWIGLEGKRYVHPREKFALIKRKGFTIITTKSENMVKKKAQGFTVSGKSHQIKSLWQDLKEIGYITKEGGFSLDRDPLHSNYLCVNRVDTDNKDVFKELVAIQSFMGGDSKFYLPEDYSKVLEFAKEQLKDELWENTEIKMELGSKKDKITIDEGKNIKFNNDFYISRGDISILYNHLTSIPPIGDYHVSIVDQESPIFRIGCIGEDHKFSFKDIASLVEAVEK